VGLEAELVEPPSITPAMVPAKPFALMSSNVRTQNKGFSRKDLTEPGHSRGLPFVLELVERHFAGFGWEQLGNQKTDWCFRLSNVAIRGQQNAEEMQ